jgi:hypothetical protein
MNIAPAFLLIPLSGIVAGIYLAIVLARRARHR